MNFEGHHCPLSKQFWGSLEAKRGQRLNLNMTLAVDGTKILKQQKTEETTTIIHSLEKDKICTHSLIKPLHVFPKLGLTAYISVWLSTCSKEV